MDLPSILYDNHRLFQPFCFLLSLTQFYKDRLLVIWTGNRHDSIMIGHILLMKYQHC